MERKRFFLQRDAYTSPTVNSASTKFAACRLDDNGNRAIVQLRWGLVPSWARDVRIGTRLINARSETIQTKPSFGAAFRSRRCLVPADGWFEWQRTGHGKRPYFLALEDGIATFVGRSVGALGQGRRLPRILHHHLCGRQPTSHLLTRARYCQACECSLVLRVGKARMSLPAFFSACRSS